MDLTNVLVFDLGEVGIGTAFFLGLPLPLFSGTTVAGVACEAPSVDVLAVGLLEVSNAEGNEANGDTGVLSVSLSTLTTVPSVSSAMSGSVSEDVASSTIVELISQLRPEMDEEEILERGSVLLARVVWSGYEHWSSAMGVAGDAASFVSTGNGHCSPRAEGSGHETEPRAANEAGLGLKFDLCEAEAEQLTDC